MYFQSRFGLFQQALPKEQLRPQIGNYSGTPIFWYNTDFIGLILKTEKFEYLILKFKNQ